jgi:hypothetical protein
VRWPRLAANAPVAAFFCTTLAIQHLHGSLSGAQIAALHLGCFAVGFAMGFVIVALGPGGGAASGEMWLAHSPAAGEKAD